MKKSGSMSRKPYILKTYGREPDSLDDLAKCVISVINDQDRLIYSNRKYRPDGKVKVVGFSWELNYTGYVSNTHECPENGVTNWGCKQDLPTHYKGFSGRVWIRLKEQSGSFGSDIFSKTLTHPSTGGFGTYSGPWGKIYQVYYENKKRKLGIKIDEPIVYSYQYYIFEDDWPLIKELMEQEQLYSKLANKSVSSMHKFLWEDEAQKIKDTEIITEYTIKNAKIEVN